MGQINSEGVVGVGEVNTRVFREALTEPQFDQVKISGKVEAFLSAMEFAKERLALCGPYDDKRSLNEMIVWLGDRIREVQDGKQIHA